MSSEIAIRAEGIGKRYRLGATHGVARYRSLREEVVGLVANRYSGADTKEFWALRDVSFEIRAGETVGIIGRNGAGKSTMLKILARITPPTTGRGMTNGRVGSLLEVGTGFHPELTGRENIMLSAAIMGMRRSEVLSRFDEIVEFSGLSTFLDTPVKRYSSGMYMRLAFSVAAHLEPEILLVDEVLAVGDAEFQKKCLGRMEELGGTGRTVLFVSHTMQSILRLCPRVILLDAGGVEADGTGTQVVGQYLGRGGGSATQAWSDPGSAPGDDLVRLKAVRVVDGSGAIVHDVNITDPVFIEVEYWRLTGDQEFSPLVSLVLCNGEGIVLFKTHSNQIELPPEMKSRGVMRSRCRIPGNFLTEGIVIVSVGLVSHRLEPDHAAMRDAVSFLVTDYNQGDGVRGNWTGAWGGVMRPMLEWQVTRESDISVSGLG